MLVPLLLEILPTLQCWDSGAVNIVSSGTQVKGYDPSCGDLNLIFDYKVWSFFFYRFRSNNIFEVSICFILRDTVID